MRRGVNTQRNAQHPPAHCHAVLEKSRTAIRARRSRFTRCGEAEMLMAAAGLNTGAPRPLAVTFSDTQFRVCTRLTAAKSQSIHSPLSGSSTRHRVRYGSRRVP
jgi:hypothetical protein